MDLKTATIFGIQSARAAGFAGQMFSLPVIEKISTGNSQPRPPDIHLRRQKALQALQALLLQDSKNIAAGIYSIDVLTPESPAKHLGRFFKIIKDGYQLSKRRADKISDEFSGEAEQYVGEVPEYYRRNYHFQSGGYLTSESAELYEHQVEILFSGGADAMRRLIIPPLKEKFGDGEGLHFLELAAGTGRLTRFMKLAFPKARITVTDLSWPYLNLAKKNLQGLDRVEFVQAAAEDLPFKGEQFDLVYSCFLFHELPEKVRVSVINESHRVLKSKGTWAMVDSMQKHDTETLKWALEDFPKSFHEPFFKNYTLKPMEKMLTGHGYKKPQAEYGFLAKALITDKAD